ncbi:hypothetical protein MSAN_00074400 [Mycena sanguinolenta]|uniref:DUF7918 domain-containing protein n=1 Tax=Mycena sanguinolenta TaxID=230812 RepID=A0A8H6ZJB7_9AGAR|nr:hypothetical protein MSAN_00074400 [Mycena sanguinolenta]
MQLKEFSAWVCIDGKEVPEYSIEVSEADKTVTCWIASELGKKFSVHWKSSFSGGTCGQVKMDGTECGGSLMRYPSTAYIDGVTDGRTLKPFVFSSLKLTDDDADLKAAPLPELGVIELYIYPSQESRLSRPSIAPCDLSTLKVHERSKKAVTQQIGLAPAEKLPKALGFVHAVRTGPNLVRFLFKYRPLDILRANGIAPPLVQPKAPTPAPPPEAAKRVKKENKPIIKQEIGEGKKRVGIKREASDVIDLTENSGLRGKKRKIEGFIQGEVIDLT